MVRILIADDHPVFRRGLKDILTQAFASAEIEEACDAAEMVDKVQREAWDLVILDLSMPGRDGLDGLRVLRRNGDTTPVLVLTMYAESQYGVRAMRGGASGYVMKGADSSEIVDAVRVVLHGSRYMSAGLAQQLLADRLPGCDRPAHDALSNREYEVLRALAAGRTVTSIAEDLALSIKTVSTYRTRVLQKLRLANTAELMRYAIEAGLTD